MIAVREELLHLFLHILELRVVEFVAPKIVHQEESAAIKILPEILDVAGKEVEVTGFGYIDERMLEQFLAINIDNSIRVCRRLDSRQSFQRGRKHGVAVRVVVMPGNFAHFLPPPGLGMISHASVHKAAAVVFSGSWRILFAGSEIARRQTNSASSWSVAAHAWSSAAELSPAELCESVDAHPQNGNGGESHTHFASVHRLGGEDKKRGAAVRK